MILLRSGTVADARAIARIHAHSFQAFYVNLVPPDALQSIDITERATIWADRLCNTDTADLVVSCNDDHPVGFIYYGPTTDAGVCSDETGHVYSLHVDPASTGSGIGGQLLQHAVSRLHQQNCRDLDLWVIKDNHRARRFYESNGWYANGRSRIESLALPGESASLGDIKIIGYRRLLD